MTIYAAAALKARIAAALDAASDGLRLDLSRVTEIDTAGLQLLLMARRLAAACRRPLVLLEPSAAVLEVIELCRLDAMIGASVSARAGS